MANTIHVAYQSIANKVPLEQGKHHSPELDALANAHQGSSAERQRYSKPIKQRQKDNSI